MKLDLDKIFIFPELDYKISSRESLDKALSDLFMTLDNNSHLIVNYLTILHDNICKEKSKKILSNTEVSEEDLKNFIINPEEIEEE